MYLTEPPKDLIRKLLVVDPKQRISITDALQHPFFQMAVSSLLPHILKHFRAYCTHIKYIFSHFGTRIWLH